METPLNYKQIMNRKLKIETECEQNVKADSRNLRFVQFVQKMPKQTKVFCTKCQIAFIFKKPIDKSSEV